MGLLQLPVTWRETTNGGADQNKPAKGHHDRVRLGCRMRRTFTSAFQAGGRFHFFQRLRAFKKYE
ncbi:MAG: hypothetical protein KatS3mg111_1789 [Pirellulaceae bacterium]|nr:MAG: hypothetical protein KatS3mg111_1789 [Pirellulaceae bacterium]